MTTTFSEPPRDFGASDEASSRYAKQLATLEQQCQSRARDTQSWRLMAFAMAGVSVPAIAATPISLSSHDNDLFRAPSRLRRQR